MSEKTTRAESLVNELEALRKSYDGYDTTRVMLWSLDNNKELSYEMETAFYEFLGDLMDKCRRRIHEIETELERIEKPLESES